MDLWIKVTYRLPFNPIIHLYKVKFKFYVGPVNLHLSPTHHDRAFHPQSTGLPAALRTSYDKLHPEGVFLLENGIQMFVWVGSNTPSSWLMDVFGVAAPHQLDPVMAELPEIDNPHSRRVRDIVSTVRAQRKRHVRVSVLVLPYYALEVAWCCCNDLCMIIVMFPVSYRCFFCGIDVCRPSTRQARDGDEEFPGGRQRDVWHSKLC